MGNTAIDSGETRYPHVFQPIRRITARITCRRSVTWFTTANERAAVSG